MKEVFTKNTAVIGMDALYRTHLRVSKETGTTPLSFDQLAKNALEMGALRSVGDEQFLEIEKTPENFKIVLGTLLANTALELRAPGSIGGAYVLHCFSMDGNPEIPKNWAAKIMEEPQEILIWDPEQYHRARKHSWSEFDGELIPPTKPTIFAFEPQINVKGAPNAPELLRQGSWGISAMVFELFKLPGMADACYACCTLLTNWTEEFVPYQHAVLFDGGNVVDDICSAFVIPYALMKRSGKPFDESVNKSHNNTSRRREKKKRKHP